MVVVDLSLAQLEDVKSTSSRRAFSWTWPSWWWIRQVFYLSPKRDYTLLLRTPLNTVRRKPCKKYYFALVMGEWKNSCKVVNAPLLKNEVNSIRVNPNGKASETRFRVLEKFQTQLWISGRVQLQVVHTEFVCILNTLDTQLPRMTRYGDRRFDAYTGK